MLVLVVLAPLKQFILPVVDLVLTLVLTEGDCSPNTFPIVGVFLGFRLSCESNFIMDLKFSCVPGDNHM